MDEPRSPADADAAHFAGLGEVSLRMMSGVVPRAARARVAALLANAEVAPWSRVVAAVLEDPRPADLVARGERAQRLWFAQAVPASARAARAARVAGKSALAFACTRSLVFVVYTAAVVALLVLAKRRWPECDIYRWFDGLGAALPSVFPR